MKLLFLCVEIFLARILDVSLGTIKTVYIVREKKITASIIAFIEIIIWFLVAKEALNTEMKSFLIPLSYGMGYASGTYVGIFLSSKLIKGTLTVNYISKKITNKDIKYLKNKGFGLSVINMNNKKKLLILEVNKKHLLDLKNILFKIDDEAFMTVDDTKATYNGFFKDI